MSEISTKLAKVALEIQAIKLQPDNPFTWASGYRMPIYNDNRLFMGDSAHRQLIADGFISIIKENHITFDIIIGTATAGIPHAITLADKLNSPAAYVRSKSKEHGKQNLIEGIIKKGQKALIIEDLVSTGGSSISAVEAVRDAGLEVTDCLSIMTYSFEKSAEAFSSSNCNLQSLLTYPMLLQIAVEAGYISNAQQQILNDWYKDPFGWGEKHGFKKVEK